jgi:hypothetical protein
MSDAWWEVDTSAPFEKRNTSSKAQKEIDRVATSAGLDRQAVNILFNTYYDEDDSGTSWITKPKPPAKEFAYAKQHGVMFDPITADHNRLIASLIAARKKLKVAEVASAFAVSLLSRRLELRSPLGSYAANLQMAAHPYQKSGRSCAICGIEGANPRKIDVNLNRFVALKFGGSIHHAMPDYAACDLETADASEPPTATGDDWEVLGKVLAALRKLKKSAQLRDLEKAVAGLFPSNKTERQQVLETLGYCGILQPEGRPSLREKYTPVDDREEDEPSNEWKCDWQWPVQHWTGKDGVNAAAVAFWFPNLAK